MKKFVSRFHYITQDLPQRSHVEQVQLACESGANWVQYRCLSKSAADLLKDLHEIAVICDDWGSTLIVTDHYHLLDEVDAQGVHVEDMDADFRKVRSLIGDERTLGASANTFAQIQQIASTAAVDYVGCGPFSVTLTKPNDYPLLGIEGYADIVDKMRASGISIPLIAVGGVRSSDIEALLAAGVDGIAVASAVNLAADPGGMFREIYKKLY